MASFIHIADERKLSLIQKNGLKLNRRHNGKKPFCHCKYCNRGEIKAKRLIIED